MTFEELQAHNSKNTKIHQELYFGFPIGMTQQEFYPFCRKLNAEGKLFDGDGSTVSKTNCTELSHPAFLFIEPLFTDGVLVGQRLFFRYQNASIFSKELSEDNLEKDVFKWMLAHYGTAYAKVNDGTQNAIVWLDGNLQLKMTRETQQMKVEILDKRVK